MNGVVLCRKHHYENDDAWKGKRYEPRVGGKPLALMFTIPHVMQAYPTCGNWQFTEDGIVVIFVSEEIGQPSVGLVGIHELVEVFLCSRGLTMSRDEEGLLTANVDKFDKEYEGDLADEEPGDDPKAPYHIEHSIATVVERLLCAKLGGAWKEHDDRVESLFQ